MPIAISFPEDGGGGGGTLPSRAARKQIATIFDSRKRRSNLEVRRKSKTTLSVRRKTDGGKLFIRTVGGHVAGTVANFTKDDTQAVLRHSLLDPDNGGAALDVTGYTITLIAISRTAGTGPAAITATLANAAAGVIEADCSTICSYTASGGITSWPETYDCQWNLVDGGAKVQRSETFQVVVNKKF